MCDSNLGVGFPIVDGPRARIDSSFRIKWGDGAQAEAKISTKSVRRSRLARWRLAIPVVLANLLLILHPPSVSAGATLLRYPYLTDLTSSHVIVNFATDTAPGTLSATVAKGAFGDTLVCPGSVPATGTPITVGNTPGIPVQGLTGRPSQQHEVHLYSLPGG